MSILKKYQVNYYIGDKVVSETIEAVSRKAARNYFKELGFTIYSKKKKIN
jgi:hypothetical protein